MNNKYTTSLLLITAVAIWGMIAYKALTFSHPFQETESHTKPTPIIVEEKKALILDYRDPFLEEVRPMAQLKAMPIIASRKGLPVSAPAWIFKGTILTDGHAACLVIAHGDTYMLRLGEELEGYRINAFSSETMSVIHGTDQFVLEVK
mgnify:CR=1 FL=1